MRVKTLLGDKQDQGGSNQNKSETNSFQHLMNMMISNNCLKQFSCILSVQNATTSNIKKSCLEN